MAGQLDVIGHDGDKIGVAGAQVSILQVTLLYHLPGGSAPFCDNSAYSHRETA